MYFVKLNTHFEDTLMNQFWNAYSEYEDELRRRFHQHRIYEVLHRFTDRDFRWYLLQIGFIAREFVKWYEVAKLGLTSESAKEVVREILRDEIPQAGATHQDDRLHDLELMGVSREEALNVRPSGGTRGVIKRLYQLVRVPQEDQDLRIMVTLRIAGEVLVAEQYRHIVDEMKRRFGVDPETYSRFYWPHYEHDLKGSQENPNSAGHTDRFDEVLASMITDRRTLKVAKEQALMAFYARNAIHDQFLDAHNALAVLKQITAAVACIIAVIFGGIVAQKAMVQYEREQWTMHIAAQSPGVAAALTDCDQELLDRFRQHRRSEDLQKVGAPNACLDAYIGP
ncbi:MAG: hypothetical protein A3C88_01495 [Candidatus Yanofskybacteria bacterium RIFCSPHIGHO2_02_FULL_50_12]|uniref:Uncharacterized protein n=1 Tax=Candidatus Yanofskybacteria bacterium RIFCSPHIGHO2_02_FULL_50_12 TaxID=1802685 RepID=A0A1F8FZG8_9BACT|nr:MAG: hypothetical protein A3C88_01495 [Candidatus Yanofskybacteria bacterium RIFCSPHIGHO2_02_FULL_50_12]